MVWPVVLVQRCTLGMLIKDIKCQYVHIRYHICITITVILSLAPAFSLTDDPVIVRHAILVQCHSPFHLISLAYLTVSYVLSRCLHGLTWLLVACVSVCLSLFPISHLDGYYSLSGMVPIDKSKMYSCIPLVHFKSGPEFWTHKDLYCPAILQFGKMSNLQQIIKLSNLLPLCCMLITGSPQSMTQHRCHVLCRHLALVHTARI